MKQIFTFQGYFNTTIVIGQLNTLKWLMFGYKDIKPRHWWTFEWRNTLTLLQNNIKSFDKRTSYSSKTYEV